jgi:inosose dehydratase
VIVTLEERLGAGPISWGVCEVPGWGRMLPADRVLREMRSVGITATELGAPGFLPHDAGALRAELERLEVRLVGGFVPLVLHDPDQREKALASARATAALFEDCGGTAFCSAALVDDGWAPRVPLDDAQWDHLLSMLVELDELADAHGLTHALHPHVGTLVETADDVARVLERSSVHWCLDTGHLTIGGYDPLQFVHDAAGRVGHVHLKDVRLDLAAKVRSSELSLMHGVQRGLFRPLGKGEVAIAEIVTALEISRYDQWYVLEQDTAITGEEPPPGEGPVRDVRESVEYLKAVVAGSVTR